MKRNHMMSTTLFLATLCSVATAQLPATIQPVPPAEIISSMETTDETVYYILRDGVYEEAMLSHTPEFITGKESMDLLLQLNIRYPDAAREKKIGGTVLVSVVIDEEGNMEDAFIRQGIGGGCNDEALRAVKLLDKTGFAPAMINGRPVTVMFDIPITFMPK